MSPTTKSPGREFLSSMSLQRHDSAGPIRKRVRKACDRCRIKKAKCDGTSPCSRCKIDDVICCAREGKALTRRNHPKGYAEMLERQQTQLASCTQELYQRLSKAGLWEKPVRNGPNERPLTHDILAALGLLEPKDDGSGDLETFHDIVDPSRSTQQVSGAEGLPDASEPHACEVSRGSSPTLPPPTQESDTSVFVGTLGHSPSSAVSVSSSPVDQTIRWPDGHPGHPHFPAQPVQTQNVQAEAHDACVIEPMRRLAPKQVNMGSSSFDLYDSHHNTYAPTQIPLPRPAPFKPANTRFDARAPPKINIQLSLDHGWLDGGIPFDDSDFLTDFHELSPSACNEHPVLAMPSLT